MRLIALLAALMLAGCSTTPEQVDRVIDLAENVATNFNAGAAGAGMPVESVDGTPDAQQPPPAPSNTQPAIADTRDALDISTARTISKYVKNIPSMPIAGDLRNVKLTADRVTFETSGEPWISSEWGRIAIVFRHNGELICGEFDARRPNQRMKGLENVHGNYIQNKQPNKGERIGLVVYDMKGTRRSNVADAGLWP